MTLSDDAIQALHVGKRLRMRGGNTLKSALLAMFRHGAAKRSDFWAVNDVTFNVRRGETLGIIGANGAGKTTLLSLLAGTMYPTTGTIKTNGTIASLLELGAGFHPDLSGRENVYLAGAIMGVRRDQMKKRFDAIVDFANLRQFIDQPVKHYSSGMYVRLGFAVAVEVDPDILLIDEVLAVGDIDFQRKCIERMHEFHRRGKTMLIVSHDLPTIQSLSDRILLLDHGRVLDVGRPADVIGAYRAGSARKSTSDISREWGSGEALIKSVTFHNAEGRETDVFQWGAPLRVTLNYETKGRIERPVFGFAIADDRGRVLYGSNTQIEQFDLPFIEGTGSLELNFPALGLGRGAFVFSFALHSFDHRTNYHRLDHAFPFAVDAPRPTEGCVYFPAQWRKL